MDDKTPPEQNQEKPAASSPNPEGIKPLDPPPAQPADPDKLTEIEREMTGFEKSTLRWARTAVIMSGLAAAFVCLQWWEMHGSGADTHNLAIAAANQAIWTQRLAGSAGIQADRTKDLADRMKDQADRTKDLAVQATIQANEAKIAANAAVGGNRAWMVPVDYGKVTNDSISVTFKNIGHSPAIQVRAMEDFVLDEQKYGPPGTPLPKFGSCAQMLRKQHGFQSASVVSPDGTFILNLSRPRASPSRETVSVITTHGCMFYTDVLTGQRRYTEYCYTALNDDRNVAAVQGCAVRNYDEVIFH